MIEKLTVVATCSVHQNQKRPTYSKMWVDRLYNSVGRNLKIPFEFVCFSNDITSTEKFTNNLHMDLVKNNWI